MEGGREIRWAGCAQREAENETKRATPRGSSGCRVGHLSSSRSSFGQPLMNGPPPIPIPIPGRHVGPCYICGQFGHLKRNCPRLLPQQYPFHSNVVDIPHTVCDSGNTGSVVCVNVLFVWMFLLAGVKARLGQMTRQLSMVLALPVRNLKP